MARLRRRRTSLRWGMSCDVLLLFPQHPLEGGSRTFRTIDVSPPRRFAPIFKTFRPRRRDDLPLFKTFRPPPCRTFCTHGRRCALYVRRFAPYVRRFAPHWDVSPPRKTFRPLSKLRHFDPPCETFRPHSYRTFRTLGMSFCPRCYRTFRTLEKTFRPRS